MGKLILCACKKGNKISKEKVEEWKSKLEEQQISFTLVEDLCGLAANNAMDLNEIAGGEKSVVIGCQPKALKNLLQKAGVEVANGGFDFYHAENTSFDKIDTENLEKGALETIKYEKDWKPWYPVLDYSLCTSCQKCLNFCLFGVYKLNDEGKVMVENPENCKDLCPACARTCPSGAIVFPKHHESPIDGGEGEHKENVGTFLSQIQQNQDVYQLLANRRKASGVSLFKIDQEQLAKEEREKHTGGKD